MKCNFYLTEITKIRPQYHPDNSGSAFLFKRDKVTCGSSYSKRINKGFFFFSISNTSLFGFPVKLSLYLVMDHPQTAIFAVISSVVQLHL